MLPAVLAAGLVATLLSVGLQGLDVLALPLGDGLRGDIWRTGFGTAYGPTATVAALAMAAGIGAITIPSRFVARGLSLAGLLAVGLALSLSGHAATAEPQVLTRTCVFLHGVCLAFWIGAFLPLIVAIGGAQRDDVMLARFSRWIPIPLATLVMTGTILAIVQLDHVDALWTTRYGLVLSCKLALVVALLALGALNRYRLVPRVAAGKAARPLTVTISCEVAIALAIFALVALWRFTPPPRALADAAHVSLHLHGERAMAQIEIDPLRSRGADVTVQVLDGEFRPLVAKELTLVLSDPGAGIEPLRRDAVNEGGSDWRIDNVLIPVAGRWRVRVEILISDFEKIVLEDDVNLPRSP
jgi:copper transport protein